MMPTKKKTKYRYRSAITGKVVTAKFAAANPDTTVKEKVKPVKK